MRNIHKLLINLKEKEISYKQASQAYINCLMRINNEFDAFYFLASMNLLNAYVKKDCAHNDFINRYTFKNHLARGLETLIIKNIDNIKIYYTDEIVYIDVFDVQFSFHNVKPNSTLNKFKCSKKNNYQEWKGIRLQPIASNLFELAENKYASSNK